MADDTPTRRIDPDDQPTVRGLAAGRTVFGRYVLEEVVGRGGMGVVWRAHDRELGEAVALKFLPEEVARDPAAVDELRQETRNARRLTHPNIVRTHDFIRADGMAAVSMEFVDGRTLSHLRVRQPGKVYPVEALAPLVMQLCAALDYAHGEARVVHRDLKPANVLVTADGRVKVADFGIARSLSETTTRLTGRGGETSGTLPYMSPQQLLGHKPAPADDIYALGATLYELLTGKPPFFRGGAFSLMKQIAEMPVEPLAERRAELDVHAGPVPAAWEETILACLAKEPRDRPASAGVVHGRLVGKVPARAVSTGRAAATVPASNRAPARAGRPEPGISPAASPGAAAADLKSARRKVVRRIRRPVVATAVVIQIVGLCVGTAWFTISIGRPDLNWSSLGPGLLLGQIGGFLLAVPAAIYVGRRGGRRWLVAAAMLAAVAAMLLAGWSQTIRGVQIASLAEDLSVAGFMAGALVYLSQWFPSHGRGMALAWLFAATPLALLIGGPILDPAQHPGSDYFGLLVILSGLAAAAGVALLALLPGKPGEARWLTEAERSALSGALASETQSVGAAGARPGKTGRLVRMALLGLVALLAGATEYAWCWDGWTFFTGMAPQGWGRSFALFYLYGQSGNGWAMFLGTGLMTPVMLVLILSSLLLAILLVIGRNSDFRQERRWHAVIPLLIGCGAGPVLALLPDAGVTWNMFWFLLAGAGLQAGWVALMVIPSESFGRRGAAFVTGLMVAAGGTGGLLAGGLTIVGLVPVSSLYFAGAAGAALLLTLRTKARVGV